jgi:uncharacterized protein
VNVEWTLLSAAVDLGVDLDCHKSNVNSKVKSSGQECPLYKTSMLVIHNSPNGVIFAVSVHPRAKKNAITGGVGDALKLSLTARPVDGKANSACTKFLAKLLKVPRSSVTIAAGHGSRNKVICVAGLSAEAVRQLLHLKP